MDSSAAMTADADAIEWEYEYDVDETEDFYITLDVSSHRCSEVVVDEQVKRQHKRKKRKNDIEDEEPKSRPSKRTHVAVEKDTPSVEEETAIQRAAAANETTQAASADHRLQILDLHSTHPFVRFNERIYSCTWSTDLGSQIYISPAGLLDQPLRPGHKVDVAGLSRVRLVARPLAIKVKRNASSQVNGSGSGTTAADAIALDDDGDEHAVEGASGGDVDDSTPVIVENPGKDATSSSTRVSFLSQLAEIKRRRGENDRVPSNGFPDYPIPSNWKEIRKRAEAIVSDEAEPDAISEQSC